VVGGTGAGGGGEPDLTPIEPDSDLGKLIQAAMERTGDKADKPDLSPLNTFAGGTRHVVTAGLAQRYGELLRSMAPSPAKLRNQVAQIIRSQERHGHERYRSVGRMDRRALARMAAGACNVYSRRTYVPGVDTAVVILIDGSGSMSHLMPLAHLMAFNLAEAIEHARGKVCIAGFWGAADQVTLAMVKGFNDKFDTARLARFGIQQSTPLSCSLLAACDLLREVHADRKIILTLTDGQCDLGPTTVQAAVAMVNRRGVECAGIGIGVDVSYAFPVNATVTDPAQLATEGLATLVRAIETGRNLTR
jgi:Mg-chelatase subunit ChlD